MCVYILPMVYVCVCIYPSLYLSVRPVCLSDTHPYLHLSIHLLYLPTLPTFTLYIYSFYLSVCLSMHPSIYLLYLSTVSTYEYCIYGIFLLNPSTVSIYCIRYLSIVPKLSNNLSIQSTYPDPVYPTCPIYIIYRIYISRLSI